MRSSLKLSANNFYFHTNPREYQFKEWERSREMEYYGPFWDMRLGKTKLMIDTMGWLYAAKQRIDAAVVVSKANVCRNWELNEFPKHLMPEIWDNARSLVFQTRYAGTKKQEAAVQELLDHRGFSVLIIPFDTFVTDAGKQAVWRMLKKRETFYTIDESARIKTPSADRTRAIVKSGKYAPYRRIMTGTPFTNGGPMDAYSPIKFLCDKFWVQRGLKNFGMYKNFFGLWETKYNFKQQREYRTLAKTDDGEKIYRNVHLLKEWIAPFTSRILKIDFPEFIPNDYDQIYFELTKEQWDLYNTLKKQLWVELEGKYLSAPLALTQLLRFQQITCGYLPDPDDPEGKKLLTIGKENPRLNCLEEYVEDVPCQGIIWCRFTQDVNLILKLLGSKAERYDGLVKECHRPDILRSFRKDKFQWLVAKASCLGEGETLANADVEVYYSNSFSLMDRVQSEERAVLLDQKKGVVIVDLVSDAPICEHITDTLRGHQTIAEQITGDKIKSWI